MHFSHILITTDFSEDSLVAFDLAAYQAKMEGTRITLINVYEEFEVPLELRRITISPGEFAMMRQDYMDAAEEQLESLSKKYFHDQDVQSVSVMSPEGAGVEICKYAAENGCDLIAIASHGRGAVKNFFLGSTANKVIRGAPCPVLVIPKKAG